jgi:hypothetical protein
MVSVCTVLKLNFAYILQFWFVFSMTDVFVMETRCVCVEVDAALLG